MLLTLRLFWLRLFTPIKYMHGFLNAGFAFVSPVMTPLFSFLNPSSRILKWFFIAFALWIAYAGISMSANLALHFNDPSHPSQFLQIFKDTLGPSIPMANPWVLGLITVFGVCVCVYLGRMYVLFFKRAINSNPKLFHEVLEAHHESIAVLQEKRRLQQLLPPASKSSNSKRL